MKGTETCHFGLLKDLKGLTRINFIVEKKSLHDSAIAVKRDAKF